MVTGRTDGDVAVREVTWQWTGMPIGHEVDQSQAATWQHGIGQYVLYKNYGLHGVQPYDLSCISAPPSPLGLDMVVGMFVKVFYLNLKQSL